jgi:HlyD family secretion protein
MFKYILYMTLLTCMVGAVVLIDSRSVDYAPPAQQPTSSNEIYATGVVEGATQDVQLRSEASGRVVEVLVGVGDWVEAGDVLVRLDREQQTQQVAVTHANLELAQAQLERLVNGARVQERDQARAMLDAKQARLDQAQRTWQRIQQLRQKAAVSQQESDDQQGLVEVLTAEVAALRAQLSELEAPARLDELRVAQARVAAALADNELSKIALKKTELLVPHAGQVLDLNVEQGELIGAESLEPAVVLADTAKLRVRAFVEEIDAPRLAVGMPASITADGLPEEVFTGRVTSLSPRMQAKSFSSGSPDELFDTKVREVVLEVEAGDGLIVGLRVDVTFSTVEIEQQ